jgi:hypothetical protein
MHSLLALGTVLHCLFPAYVTVCIHCSTGVRLGLALCFYTCKLHTDRVMHVLCLSCSPLRWMSGRSS